MKRGEVWTVSGANDYAGKPRPSLIVQDEAFSDGDSVTVCGFTSDLSEASLIRVRVTPSVANGLYQVCDVMVDKVTTVPRTKLGRRIGVIEGTIMDQVGAAIVIFLGLASGAVSGER